MLQLIYDVANLNDLRKGFIKNFDVDLSINIQKNLVFMTQNLVSVIIPTYNRSDLLGKAIQSVKDQSYPAIQIIIADDGSQDNTKDVIKQFDDIEYYYQENKGQGAARNLGLKHAKGEYITSLDSDDIWYENFLETAVSALEKYDADFVFLNWTEFSGSKKDLSDWERGKIWQNFSNHKDGEWSLLNDKEVRKLFVTSCPSPSSALLIKRSSMFSGWNEEIKIADDWYMVLEMILNKPCRAAFTLTPYWKKHVHIDNIYHGRDYLEVLKEFGLHDEPMFANDFYKLMTPLEKSIMRQRQAVNHLNYVRLKMKRDGVSEIVFRNSFKTLRFLTTAFTFSPISSTSYIIRLFRDHLKNRRRIAKTKKGKLQTFDDELISRPLDDVLKSKVDEKV